MGALEMPDELSNAAHVVNGKNRRSSEPRIHYLGTAEIFAPLPPSKWVTPELHIGPGRPIMLAGYGSSAKTLSAQALALAIASGRPAWDRFDTVMGEVRHLDYEQGSPATRRRYQRLAIGHGIELDELGDRLKLCAMPSVFLDEKNVEDELARASDGASLVIVDAFRGATPSSDENDSAVRRGLDVLTRVSERNGASFLMIHHAGKPKDGHDDPRTIARGSSAIFDACGCVFVIGAGKKSTDPKRVRQTKQPAESEGAPVPDFALVVEDVERDGNRTAGVRISHRAIEEADDTEAKAAQQYETDSARLVRVIVGHPGITMNQLALRASMKKARMKDVIDALADEGRISVTDGPRNSKACWPADGAE
jgi:hypothetical protein